MHIRHTRGVTRRSPVHTRGSLGEALCTLKGCQGKPVHTKGVPSRSPVHTRGVTRRKLCAHQRLPRRSPVHTKGLPRRSPVTLGTPEGCLVEALCTPEVA